jgi:hypothetical protein
MRRKSPTLYVLTLTAAALSVAFSPVMQAEEKFDVAKEVSAPARKPEVDRDGKVIYGYKLMTETELGGYRSQLFFIKSLEDRDAVRAEHRRAMDKRAAERGVKIEE